MVITDDVQEESKWYYQVIEYMYNWDLLATEILTAPPTPNQTKKEQKEIKKEKTNNNKRRESS